MKDSQFTIAKSDLTRFVQLSEKLEWGTHAKAIYFSSLHEAKTFSVINNLKNISFQREN